MFIPINHSKNLCSVVEIMSKTAIITGVTGQDGAYLTRLLLKKKYKVFGTYRRTASSNFWRLKELGVLEHSNLELVEYDLNDLSANIRLLERAKADEFYNLAAQSFVAVSFDQPILTCKTSGLGAVNILEAIRIVNAKTRFYQASTSEMFGLVKETPQSESTPFYPRSPYGCAKVLAHQMAINYRESYGIFASCGILFNHESPLRGLEFVTRKVTDGLVRVKLEKATHIELGNLDAKRDWGYADDYVSGMWKMLQLEKPDEFVLATGRTETIRVFVEMACRALDIEIVWQGSGVREVGIDNKTGREIVKINQKFYRPAEVDLLLGDSQKALEVFGWSAKTELEELCKLMVEADLGRIQKEHI